MENNKLEELLVLYALGELEPDEATAVEAELQKRPELAAQVEKVRRADGLLSDVFAQSDAAAQQTVVEESVKPKIADKSETSRRLARRFALASAAMSLFFVVVALFYPQFVKNDVQVAMTTQETTENKSVSLDVVTEGVKREEPAPTAEGTVMEEAQKEAPLFAFKAMDDADVAAEAVEEAEMTDADTAEDDMAAPAPAAAPALGDANISEVKAFRNAADSPEPEEVQAQYYMKNALYDIPSQKTADGMSPIKGEIPPMKQGLLPEESLGEMAVDQMNKRLDSQRKVNAEKSALKKSRQKGIAYGDEAPLVPGSYVVLQKSVMEGNRLPNPESVKVEQWLSYFGVDELVKTTEDKNEDVEEKDVQFAKAMNLFGTLLLGSNPADVKDFEEVLDLLKDSVGDDPKRQEFKAIVEKTIEMKKKGARIIPGA